MRAAVNRDFARFSDKYFDENWPRGSSIAPGFDFHGAPPVSLLS